jgi:hypothetical protein
VLAHNSHAYLHPKLLVTASTPRHQVAAVKTSQRR